MLLLYCLSQFLDGGALLIFSSKMVLSAIFDLISFRSLSFFMILFGNQYSSAMAEKQNFLGRK